MHFYLGLLILSCLVTFILMVPFINILFKMKFTRKDEGSEVRKGAPAAFYKIREMQSQKPMLVTGGGILVAAVVILIFSVVIIYLSLHKNLFSGHPLTGELAVIFFTFIGFGILGLYDDIIKIFGFAKTGFFGLRMRHKFILQWILGLTSALIIYYLLGIDIVYIPFWGLLNLGALMIPVAAFIIVGFANAFDFTDGLDGLSCGLLMICLMAFWVISMYDLDHILSVFIAVWIGALMSYLYFNIYPARIMLGNVGGLAFGATLAVVGLLSGKIVALLVIGGVFVAEGMSSLLQLFSKRFMKKRIFPIAPLHHWLQLVGWEEPKIVARAWLVGICLAIFGVWLAVL
jgi:phospho-N-acetylmuramoyl-pentapeptide-transferase